MQRVHPSLRAMCLLILLICIGCNSRIATYAVSGTVHFDDGKPVPYGSIEFRNEQTGQSARGKLDAAGAFELGTFSANDGAPVGSYRVIVVQFFNPPPATAQVQMHDEHAAHDPDADARVATEVSDFSTSPLRAEVSPDGKNHFDFVVPRHSMVRASSPRPIRSAPRRVHNN